jgi:hypothetical protein
MPLVQQYLDQADIPLEVRQFYTEQDGGAWRLEVDPPIEDIGKLKDVLDNERRIRRDAERQLMEWKGKFEGVDPDEINDLRERVKHLDDSEIYDKQGIEALILKRTSSMQAEHERLLRQKEHENAQLKEQVSTLDQRWRHDRIKTALLDAVTKAGVYEKAVDDAVQRGLAVFNDLSEDGTVIAKQSTKDGDEIAYGKDGINPLSPAEWIGMLKTSGQAPHLWGPSSGGGASPLHGGPGGQVDWNALPPTERLTKFRESQAAATRR